MQKVPRMLRLRLRIDLSGPISTAHVKFFQLFYSETPQPDSGIPEITTDGHSASSILLPRCRTLAAIWSANYALVFFLTEQSVRLDKSNQVRIELNWNAPARKENLGLVRLRGLRSAVESTS